MINCLCANIFIIVRCQYNQNTNLTQPRLMIIIFSTKTVEGHTHSPLKTAPGPYLSPGRAKTFPIPGGCKFVNISHLILRRQKSFTMERKWHTKR